MKDLSDAAIRRDAGGSHCVGMIGLDLDGTVFTDRKTVTSAVAQAIETAGKKGIHVVPVTGRPLNGIPASVLSLKGIRYAIASNGAVIYDCLTKEIMYGYFLSAQTALFLAEYARKKAYMYSIFVGGYGYLLQDDHRNMLQLFEGTHLHSYVAASRRGVEDLGAFMKETALINPGRQQQEIFRKRGRDLPLNEDCIENVWVSCGNVLQANEAGAVVREYDPEANILRTLPEDIEVVSPQADKGRAFMQLAGICRVPREETMAIGDSLNDIGFMKEAGIPVAMGNASDEIKDLASYITSDNEHDGVALAIETFCS